MGNKITIEMDLGESDVHLPGAVQVKKMDKYTYECDGKSYECEADEDEVDMIDAQTRKGLPTDQFALPDQRKYPIDTAARTRNAAARLEQMKKAGKISDSDYSKARAAISRAAKKFGIDSEYNKRENDDGGEAMDMSVYVPTAAVEKPEMKHMSLRGEVVELRSLSDPNAKQVWIQVAKQGKFRGHAAGPFEMSLQTFEEIIRNFKASQNQSIPVDFEHASEQEPTEGSIPVNGAPAQGWILDLKIGNDGNLYGLVEWLPLAREYIQKKQYKFLSPAIVFGAKDRVTGKAIGARLSSVALTNNPFLDGMAPLAAKHREAPASSFTIQISGDRISFSERPVNQFNDGGASSGDRPNAEVSMSDVNKQVTDLSTQLAETKINLSNREGKIVELSEKLAASDAKAKEAEVKVAEVTLALNETTAKLTAADEELKTLRAWKETEEQRRFDERLSEAFETYKDARKMTDADKEMMRVFLKAEPTKFEERFPKIPADKKHLMRNLAGNEPKEGKNAPVNTIPAPEMHDAQPASINLADAALALAAQRKIPLDQAQRIIFAQANKAKRAG